MAKKPRYTKVAGAFWAAVLVMLLSYLPTRMLETPVAGMALAATTMAWFGVTARSYRRAAVRGLGLGLLAGLTINAALLDVPRYAANPRHVLMPLTGVFLGATMAMCTAVALFFQWRFQVRLRQHRGQ
jgi:hypothetical protein